jgi:soluble lytic murein transglycosylase-like protein
MTSNRHLRGLTVLLLTMLPGYLACRPPDADLVRHMVNRLAGLAARLVGSPNEVAIESHIQEAATRYGISPGLIAAIIEAESDFNPRAVSRRGARGLMQLMPETAARLGVEDPFDPRENIEAGVRHLRSLMDQFGNDLPRVLAAYNAGEHAVVGHRGIPPYRETQRYVRRILRRLDRDDAVTPGARQGRRPSLG